MEINDLHFNLIATEKVWRKKENKNIFTLILAFVVAFDNAAAAAAVVVVVVVVAAVFVVAIFVVVAVVVMLVVPEMQQIMFSMQ